MHLDSITITTCTRVESLIGKCIKFDSRINFLVGENGSGKSTILRALGGNKLSDDVLQFKTDLSDPNAKEKLQSYYFDSEKMNPRVRSRVETVFDAHMLFMSHGECLMICTDMIKKIPKDNNHLSLLDEPESGISPWNQVKLRDVLIEQSKHCQIIVATHSLILTKMNIGQVIKLGPKITYHSPASSFDWQV